MKFNAPQTDSHESPESMHPKQILTNHQNQSAHDSNRLLDMISKIHDL